MRKKAQLETRTLIELIVVVIIIIVLSGGISELIKSSFWHTAGKEKKESAVRNFEAMADLIEDLEEGQEIDDFPIYLYNKYHAIVGFERDKSHIYGICVDDQNQDEIPYIAYRPPMCGDEGGCLCICEKGYEAVSEGKPIQLFCQAGKYIQCFTEYDFGREISFIGGYMEDPNRCSFAAVLPKKKEIYPLYIKRENEEYVRICADECDGSIELLSLESTAPREYATISEAEFDEMMALTEEFPEIQVELVSSPTLITMQVQEILEYVNSPLSSYSENFLDHSYEYGIDNVLALSFFTIETELATSPDFEAREATCSPGTYNPGNVPYGSACIAMGGDNCGGFCQYDNWEEGIEGWYYYIKTTFIDKEKNTVDEVVYAQCKFPDCVQSEYLLDFYSLYVAYEEYTVSEEPEEASEQVE